MELFLIHPKDNVEVDLENGHKYARTAIKAGQPVIKYGFPIGEAKCDIAQGEHVHTHNLRTALRKDGTYTYRPQKNVIKPETPDNINAYLRNNGDIGIRNDIWIVNTVGCVNRTAQKIAEKTGAFCFTHPYGCSQLGEDHARTQKILRGLILHPNAGGVLVLGLGCENNGIESLRQTLGDYDMKRIRFLKAQDVEDEIREGVRIVKELQEIAARDRRVGVPVSKLRLGLKCGGSDGYSGITANPMVGRISDHLISMGGTSVLTEVPEMFGAEQLLMDRCVNEEVFNDTVRLINRFKAYFTSHGQPVSENPSPGNKEGGITTLEEKSLGCVQKGGRAPVTAVLGYGDIANKPGLLLLDGPGNDAAAVTNLTAAGCHMILFTTGRGTPLGAPVPTVKIATNSALYKKKPNWIDFNAMDADAESLWDVVLQTANGKETKNELGGYREIAIFKDGVTL